MSRRMPFTPPAPGDGIPKKETVESISRDIVAIQQETREKLDRFAKKYSHVYPDAIYEIFTSQFGYKRTDLCQKMNEVFDGTPGAGPSGGHKDGLKNIFEKNPGFDPDRAIEDSYNALKALINAEYKGVLKGHPMDKKKLDDQFEALDQKLQALIDGLKDPHTGAPKDPTNADAIAALEEQQKDLKRIHQEEIVNEMERLKKAFQTKKEESLTACLKSSIAFDYGIQEWQNMWVNTEEPLDWQQKLKERGEEKVSAHGVVTAAKLGTVDDFSKEDQFELYRKRHNRVTDSTTGTFTRKIQDPKNPGKLIDSDITLQLDAGPRSGVVGVRPSKKFQHIEFKTQGFRDEKGKWHLRNPFKIVDTEKLFKEGFKEAIKFAIVRQQSKVVGFNYDHIGDFNFKEVKAFLEILQKMNADELQEYAKKDKDGKIIGEPTGKYAGFEVDDLLRAMLDTESTVNLSNAQKKELKGLILAVNTQAEDIQMLEQRRLKQQAPEGKPTKAELLDANAVKSLDRQIKAVDEKKDARFGGGSAPDLKEVVGVDYNDPACDSKIKTELDSLDKRLKVAMAACDKLAVHDTRSLDKAKTDPNSVDAKVVALQESLEKEIFDINARKEAIKGSYEVAKAKAEQGVIDAQKALDEHKDPFKGLREAYLDAQKPPVDRAAFQAAQKAYEDAVKAADAPGNVVVKLEKDYMAALQAKEGLEKKGDLSAQQKTHLDTLGKQVDNVLKEVGTRRDRIDSKLSGLALGAHPDVERHKRGLG